MPFELRSGVQNCPISGVLGVYNWLWRTFGVEWGPWGRTGING